jgi:hypothetical protein
MPLADASEPSQEPGLGEAESIGCRLRYRLFRGGRVAKTQRCEEVGEGDVYKSKRLRALLPVSPSVHLGHVLAHRASAD